MLESYLFLSMCMRLLSYIPTVLFISTIISAVGYIMLPTTSRTWPIIFILLLGLTWASHVLVSQFHRFPILSKLLPQIPFSLSIMIWLLYFSFFLLSTQFLRRTKRRSFSIGLWLFLILLFHHMTKLLENSLI